MEYRNLGSTGLRVSAVGFGCGAVGGLLVKGTHAEMVAAVRRAVDLGVNYFDTAPLYADGVSETNLGRVLAEVGADVVVGTKVRLTAADLDDVEGAVTRSVETSLARLRRDCLDLIQVHNYVMNARVAARNRLSVGDVVQVVEVFRTLRDQGKVRFWGINGLGDPAAVRQAVAGGVHTAQVCLNLLNPTAGYAVPAGFPFDDYAGVIDRAADHAVGVIAIRVLAGGALSGSADRHPHATVQVDPIASGNSFAADVELAQRFRWLVDEGFAASLAGAAVRFAVGTHGVATALVGVSTLAQLEEAVTAAASGPLPDDVQARLHAVWAGFAV